MALGATWGQVVNEPPLVSLNSLGFSVNSWSEADGVPASYVSSMTLTPDGYVWWESGWGVVRFDGARSTPFLAPASPDGGLQEIEFLFSDSSGKVWVTGGSSAGVVEGGQIRWLQELPGRVPGRGGILEDPQGKVWAHVTTEDCPRLLVRIDAASGQEDHQRDPGDVRLPVAVDFAGEEVWASTLDGLVPVAGAPSHVPEALSGDVGSVGELFRLQDGSLAVACRDGIYARRQGEWQLVRRFSPRIQGRLDGYPAMADRDGNFWVALRNGDLLLSLPDERTFRVDLPGFAKNREFGIQAMLCDRENNIWLGTRDRVYQIHKVSFEQAQQEPFEEDAALVDLAFDSNEGIWGIGNHRFDNLVYYARGESEGQLVEGASDVLHIATGEGGDVWAASPLTLWQLREGRMVEAIPFSEEGVPRSLDAVGREVIMGTNQGGFRLREGALTPFGPPGAPVPANVHLAPGNRGEVWCHYPSIGLYRFADDEWKPWPLPNWASHREPNGMHVDPEDRLWIYGKGSALLCFDGKGWTDVLSSKDGIPIEILGVVSDQVKSLWILTQAHGVARADREPDDAGGRRIEWFHVADGLPSNFGLGWGKGANASPDGRIWLATDAGVAVVDPEYRESLRLQSVAPQIHVEEVLVDGLPAPRTPGGLLQVPRTAGLIEIHYTALGLKDAAKNRFRYRLEGWDSEWNEAGTRRTAWYQRIRPGNYRFQVIAANSDGKWNREGRSLEMAVLPAWWERRGVKGGAFLLVLGMVAGVVHVRLRRFRHERQMQERFSRQLLATQEEERNRIARELHDSLGQEMLVLKGRLDLTGMEHPELKASFSGLSEALAGTIRRARSLSHDLRPPHLEHLGLSKALEVLATDLRRGSNLEVNTQIEELSPRLSADAEIGLYRITQEAVANVLKHGEATALAIILTRTVKRVVLSIRDDGKGFDLEGSKKNSSLGLRGMAERANLLQGKFVCETRPSQGTVIRVSVDVETAPSAASE